MKRVEARKSEVAMCFMDNDDIGYLRTCPRSIPIWYMPHPDGFDVITDASLYNELEKAYNDKEQ